MTPKYYYDCPLKAAYMQKYFNARLLSRHSDEQVSEFDLKEENRFFPWEHATTDDGSVEPIIEDALKFIDEASGNKIYIHPDDNRIFEPKKDDIVDLDRHGFGIVVEFDGTKMNCALFDLEVGAFKSGYWYFVPKRIILRGSNQFFMPEVVNETEND